MINLLGAMLRLAPAELLAASLIVVAGFLSGEARMAAWLIALAIDYGGLAIVALGGWRIAPAHFAERHGLIVLIALGESIVAIGVGAGFELTAGSVAGAALGVVVISALWWLYFDVAAIFGRRQLMQRPGISQSALRVMPTAISTCRSVVSSCSRSCPPHSQSRRWPRLDSSAWCAHSSSPTKRSGTGRDGFRSGSQNPPDGKPSVRAFVCSGLVSASWVG